MAFKRLDSVVERVLSRVTIIGETGVDAPSQPKRTASAKPAAKSKEETKHPSPRKRPVLRLIQGSRDIDRAPHELPRSARSISLVLVGGRDHATEQPLALRSAT